MLLDVIAVMIGSWDGFVGVDRFAKGGLDLEITDRPLDPLDQFLRQRWRIELRHPRHRKKGCIGFARRAAVRRVHTRVLGQVTEPHDLLEFVDRSDRLDEQLLGTSEKGEEVDGLAYQAGLLSIVLDYHRVRSHAFLIDRLDNCVIVTVPTVNALSKLPHARQNTC
jgi:hypothetical protein